MKFNDQSANNETPFSSEKGVSFPIEHLSYSSIGLLERCPKAFYYRYIKGIKSSPNWKMITGSAFDETLNFHYDQKKATGKDEPLDVLQDHVKEEFEHRKDEASWIPGQDIKAQQGKVLTACTKGLKIFRDKILTKVEPEGTQIEIYHEFTPGLKFKGYIDLLENKDGSQVIVDNKTTWRRWSGKYKLWQLVVYSYMMSLQGQEIRETRYDVCLLKKRDDPEIAQFTDFITDDQHKFMARKLDWAVKYLTMAIKDPSLFNHNFNTWQCGNSCQYVTQCELELGMKLK
jgi:hypothetical protein